MSRCQRCGRETNVTTMSWFNDKMICADGDDSCSAREEKRPGIDAAIGEGDEACRRRHGRHRPRSQHRRRRKSV